MVDGRRALETKDSTADSGALFKDALAPAKKHGEAKSEQAEVKIEKGQNGASENDRMRLAYLQMTLHNLLPDVVAGNNSNSSEKSATFSAEQIKDLKTRQSDIKTEVAKGQFGPATRKAYGEYVGWLEDKAIPGQIGRLRAFGLPAADSGSTAAKLDFEHKIDLKIDSGHAPDDAQMIRLDAAIDWIKRSEERIKPREAALLENFDSQLSSTIRQNGLPRGWLDNIDVDRPGWRNTTGKLVNTALSTRTYIEIIDELNKSSGEKISTAPDGVKLDRDASGKISRIDLNLPSSWRDLSTTDQKKVDNLDKWVIERKAELAPVMVQMRAFDKKPERALNWGDTELKGMQGRFDAEGNLLGLTARGAAAKPGETLKDVNLLESRFNISEKDNKITVTQEVQAQSAPWWSYQNMIGVDNVGKKTVIEHTYNKDEKVVVRTADGFETMKAQDLENYRRWEMTKHYGQKTLMAALDVGMVATGTIEVGAAFKAVRVAEVAGELALKTGVEQNLGRQAFKGALRATVGGAGIFNNAGARESDLGQYVNTARSVYFLTDVSAGLATDGWRAIRSGLNKGTLELAPKAVAGLTAGSASEKIYHGTHTMFKVSEYGFAPLVASDIFSQVKKLNNDKAAHLRRAALLDALENSDSDGNISSPKIGETLKRWSDYSP